MADEAKKVKEVPATDDFVVDWDSDDDPANPLNWPSKRKGINIALLSCLTFVTYVLFDDLVVAPADFSEPPCFFDVRAGHPSGDGGLSQLQHILCNLRRLNILGGLFFRAFAVRSTI